MSTLPSPLTGRLVGPWYQPCSFLHLASLNFLSISLIPIYLSRHLFKITPPGSLLQSSSGPLGLVYTILAFIPQAELIVLFVSFLVEVSSLRVGTVLSILVSPAPRAFDVVVEVNAELEGRPHSY